MSLFAADPAQNPLADRMRPRTFDEVVGQEHLTAPGAPFRVTVEEGKLASAILWGPPGVGKTTLARIVAAAARVRFVPFSAVLAGIKEVREVMEQARRERAQAGTRTLVLIDEIHRFNKAQQDAFLPHVESGDVLLLGATTENPSFEVNAALLSRCAVYVLKPLEPPAMAELLARALADPERGLGGLRVELEPGLLDDLAAFADGDARRGLNALEALARAARPAKDGVRRVTREQAARVLEKRLLYDKKGEGHYDTVSAFIKSVRNSDPDAAVYWLARMLEAGEDPLFVARRIVILAGEDVGLADPRALPVAVAAYQAAHFIGMPEALFPLTEATLYLALAPKSNSVKGAYHAALRDVRERPNAPVPLHLRNAVTGLMRSLGYGRGYRYAHDDPRGGAAMSCLPEPLAGRSYYEARAEGEEADLAAAWRRRREEARAGGSEALAAAGAKELPEARAQREAEYMQPGVGSGAGEAGGEDEVSDEEEPA